VELTHGFDRPQHGGPGKLLPAVEEEVVLHLERLAERGEPPPMSLLLKCLQELGCLELGCRGHQLLWMVTPVLASVRRQLLQDAAERRGLRAEAEALQRRAEQVAMQVEDDQTWQLREQERCEKVALRRQQQLEALLTQAKGFQRQRLQMEAQCRQLEVEAPVQQDDPWLQEQAQLEAELDALNQQVEELEANLAGLLEPKQLAQEHLDQLSRCLGELKPDLEKKENLRFSTQRLEAEMEDLEKEIYERARKKRSRASKSSKSKPLLPALR